MGVFPGRVLLIGGNADLRSAVAAAVRASRFQLTTVAKIESACKLIAGKRFDLILVDATTLDGRALQRLADLDLTEQGRVVLAGRAGVTSVGSNTEARSRFDCLAEPLSVDAMARLLREALVRSPAREIPATGDFSGMIGRTARMQKLFENIRRVARLDVGVLVCGESGTGKELVARAVHLFSGRPGKFVAVNCGAISPELLSSHLFGHERGSFTGATQSHAGYFEQAQDGTLFLDEITEMSPALQVYLLRVIESHTLTRVGGSNEISVDARVIAASNRDLQHAVTKGELRSDLYFRLLEFPLVVPPLRERRGDIPLLAQHFLDQLNDRYGTHKRFAEHVMDRLLERTWPGNVRELRHTVYRQYILAGDDEEVVFATDPGQPVLRRASDRGRLPLGSPDHVPAPTTRDDAIRFAIGTSLDDIEREALMKTLAHFHNNKREAARALGVSLKTIYNKLWRYRSRGVAGQDGKDDTS